MISAALKALEESPDRSDPDLNHVYDDVASHYQSRLTTLQQADEVCAVPSPEQDHFENVSRRLRDRERAVAIELRDQDRINDEVLRELLRELDLLDVRQTNGIMSD